LLRVSSRAVSIRMGRSERLRRMRLSTSRPSSRGSEMSRRTRSTGSSTASREPSSPSYAQSTLWPCAFRPRSKKRAIAASSSTIRTSILNPPFPVTSIIHLDTTGSSLSEGRELSHRAPPGSPRRRRGRTGRPGLRGLQSTARRQVGRSWAITPGRYRAHVGRGGAQAERGAVRGRLRVCGPRHGARLAGGTVVAGQPFDVRDHRLHRGGAARHELPEHHPPRRPSEGPFRPRASSVGGDPILLIWRSATCTRAGKPSGGA
jgi:hypothetical protein